MELRRSGISMANTYCQIYMHIVFAVRGRENVHMRRNSGRIAKIYWRYNQE
jgi:hypothetical protein